MADWLGLRESDRTALFIDGANLYKTARNLGFDIDYRSLLARVSEKCRLIRAYYYTAIQEDKDQDYSPLRPLVDWLHYNGYAMVTKPAREFTDATGKKRFKGSIDIELAIDMVQLADKLDHIILFTGNGDFRRAVEAVQIKGVRVTVCSSMKSQPAMASDELRRQADLFIDVADLEKLIGRQAGAGGGGRKPVSAYQDEYDDDEEDDYEDEEDDVR